MTEQKLREALERIRDLTPGGPHLNAQDGMGAALASLDRARDIARAALDASAEEVPAGMLLGDEMAGFIEKWSPWGVKTAEKEEMASDLAYLMKGGLTVEQASPKEGGDTDLAYEDRPDLVKPREQP